MPVLHLELGPTNQPNASGWRGLGRWLFIPRSWHAVLPLPFTEGQNEFRVWVPAFRNAASVAEGFAAHPLRSGRFALRFPGVMIQKMIAGMIAVLSVAIAVISLRYFFLPDTAPLLQLKSGIQRVILLVHAGASLIALAVGPFQFSGRLRRRWTGAHRNLGYLYFAGVLIGGLAGLCSAVGAEGGLSARVGFFLLGVCWLASAWMALSAIRQGDVARHEQWMIRNFALTFAAVTLRLWLPALTVASGSFQDAYRTVAWLCWVPNAIVAEILLHTRTPGGRRPERRGNAVDTQQESLSKTT